MMKCSVLIAAATAATAAFAFIPSTAALAEPASTTGCPASFQVLNVQSLLDQGYRAPAVVDGEGNGNGTICGKPFNSVQQEKICPAVTCTVPVIYAYRDDNLAR